ncbi:GntR family transcriptional regulator [Lachnospiraceae bacterium PF1-21]|uniref:GntR family transcriptional regulator n=1 Tax=Ohessyouella blattaphilus TaxID=2949333 RepID=UPI0025628F9C|nr:GntR family transcriptional regulator [Lachnospiraceae bacterium OttesenSCG-928-J05]
MEPRNFLKIETVEKLEHYISTNSLTKNTKLPPERELCELLNVSRSTLRAALLELVDRNIIYSTPSAGNYVAPPKQARNLVGVNSMAKDIRNQEDSLTTKILSFTKASANRQTANKLGLDIHAPIYACSRLRFINQQPCYLENVFLSANLLPDFDQLYQEHTSMYQLFDQHYHKPPLTGQERISITYASSEEGKLLKVPKDTPLFFVSGVSYWDDKQPLEYYKALFRGDRFKFVSKITRNSYEKE